MAPVDVQSSQAAIVQQLLAPGTNAPRFDFSFAPFLRREYGFGRDPERPVCKAWESGHCPLGNECPDKHPPTASFSNVVCKHWLRGLCKKGENCEFLHEYNLRRMPACSNFAKYLSCPNGDDCLYQHVPAEAKRPVCQWFERGFCPLGPLCASRHVKRDIMCELFLAGFCPDGRRVCRRGAHPRWRKDEDMKKPEVWVPKSPEELEREREEREREVALEQERERELREERGASFAGSFNVTGPGGPASGNQQHQKFGNRQGGGGGHWKKNRKRGGGGGGGGGGGRQRGGY